jgi:hypothetical protein
MESEFLMNIPVTRIPRCVSCSVKTLGFKHLQLLGMGLSMSSRCPDGAYIIHCRMGALLMKQCTVSGG